ncbi:acyl-CoA synthetase [Planococcus salinus]|uniref:Acyl-CoA synthetase n=2 Tax=Planococcus salinus TaxID=1848460 RepID=A0A3M8PAT7_9BACL|nr:acyl-CoA synthetase [Planococcus salinus]
MIQDEHVVVKKLEEWAEIKGEKNFFYYGENDFNVSYREFNELTNSIGHSFQNLGLDKGDRISVFMKNAYICSLSMFGIWKAGGVYAPINFNYTGKSLSYLINDTDPVILLVERGLLQEFQAIKQDLTNKNLKVIVYDPKESDHDYEAELMSGDIEELGTIPFESLFEGDKSNVKLELDYSDMASIIYTSGTTGLPKGVVQSHRWLYGYAFYYGKMLTQEDVIYNDLPLYHVGGAFFNITRAVFVGCEVAVWDKFSSNHFWDRIKISQSTSAVLVGVMTTWLMNAKETDNDRNNTLNKVHIQPLPSFHHELAKRFGFDFILAGFGQTEAGFGICGLIKELDEETGTPSSYYRGHSRKKMTEIAEQLGLEVRHGTEAIEKGYLGKPGIFFEATILNEKDEECAAGEIGELAIRPKLPSIILSEYFRKKEETLKVFKNLWFHTGDSAYRDAEGGYYFVDRQGSILKVKGEKFSSYQVEDLIYEHPSIQMSAVFPIPAEYGDEIVVYAVIENGQSLNEEEFRQWIEQKIPKYMWPKYIRFVEDIPKTLTNKIQKFKLKEEILKELQGAE